MSDQLNDALSGVGAFCDVLPVSEDGKVHLKGEGVEYVFERGSLIRFGYGQIDLEADYRVSNRAQRRKLARKGSTR